MSHEIDEIRRVMQVTDRVSPSFCLAKWHHVTIYLQTGETHSCYHPAPHKIPAKELISNPSVLHNTPEKKLERKAMLEGQRPKGCQYCWNVEDMGPDFISDRQIRTRSIYKPERLAEITSRPWDFNVNPEYIELSFGNECNFKCGYCHPKASSRLWNEIKQHGPYTMVKNHRLDIDWFKTYPEDDNPYVDAWWRWWPEVSKTLNILRLTGGEPLMHKSTWRLLESLREKPLPALELNINSNLGGPQAWVERLSNHVAELLANRSIKRFKLFTSIDTWGERAEYLRTGLNLETWERNLDTYINITRSRVMLMITFNILSVTSFQTLLEKILFWRQKYNALIPDSGLERKVRFDTPYLKEPLQYDMNLLPKSEFMPYMHRALEFMRQNTNENDVCKFSELEFERFRRVVKYMEGTHYPEARLTEGRRDFFSWFNEYDRRRDLSFARTFPEYTEFMELCANHVQ
jgi:hypothetical protein